MYMFEQRANNNTRTPRKIYLDCRKMFTTCIVVVVVADASHVVKVKMGKKLNFTLSTCVCVKNNVVATKSPQMIAFCDKE